MSGRLISKPNGSRLAAGKVENAKGMQLLKVYCYCCCLSQRISQPGGCMCVKSSRGRTDVLLQQQQ